MTYPKTVSCGVEECEWTHDARDEDDETLAWQWHVETNGCPQRHANQPVAATELPTPRPDDTDSNVGPDDPIGTVRAAHGWLAVRTYTAADPDGNALAWFIIDIGAQGELPGYPLPMDQMTLEELGATIASWPIVYQP